MVLLAFMQTTKQQLLALLKRTGSVTVEEAAGALAIASMTARQHLVDLEKEELVHAERVRRRAGRPVHLYTLTPKGEAMFPRRYDLFAQLLLEEVGCLRPAEIEGLSAEEKRTLLFKRAAARLADRLRPPMTGRPLEERVAGVTAVLHQIGGFAEWRPLDAGFEIIDYNCVFAGLVAEQRSNCEWHVHLLSQLLGSPVRHELQRHGRSACCRYVIAEEGPPHV